MKKALASVLLVFTLALSLVSCRNYDADNGVYGYYNNRSSDRENMSESVTEQTKNRIKSSYDKAKKNVKNAIGNVTEDIQNAVGVR